MDQKEFGKLIAKKRKDKKLTQSELAEKLGLSSYKTISKWENGVYMPDISLLTDISEILDVGLYELLGGKEIIIENEVNNILKNTINKVKNKNKKLKIFKIIIIILSILLFVILSLLLTVVYQKNSYLFTIRPEEVNLNDFNMYFPYVNQDNFNTKYVKKRYLLGSYLDKEIGIEEEICEKLPLYKIKDYPVDINANTNQIIYDFGSRAEEDINKEFKDTYYTKKSMFIISIILYRNVANLENIEFYYNDTYYNVSIDLIKKYYEFINDYFCNPECEYWNYLDIKDLKKEVTDRMTDKAFLDEFLINNLV